MARCTARFDASRSTSALPLAHPGARKLADQARGISCRPSYPYLPLFSSCSSSLTRIVRSSDEPCRRVGRQFALSGRGNAHLALLPGLRALETRAPTGTAVAGWTSTATARALRPTARFSEPPTAPPGGDTTSAHGGGRQEAAPKSGGLRGTLVVFVTAARGFWHSWD